MTLLVVVVTLDELLYDFLKGFAQFFRSIEVSYDARVFGDDGLLLAVTNYRLPVYLLGQNDPASKYTNISRIKNVHPL